MKKLHLFNLSHDFAATTAEDKPIFLPFGKWAYDEKVSQSLDREHAERIANELNARVGRGEPGIPVYQGHPDVPQLASKRFQLPPSCQAGHEAHSALDLSP